MEGLYLYLIAIVVILLAGMALGKRLSAPKLDLDSLERFSYAHKKSFGGVSPSDVATAVVVVEIMNGKVTCFDEAQEAANSKAEESERLRREIEQTQHRLTASMSREAVLRGLVALKPVPAKK